MIIRLNILSICKVVLVSAVLALSFICTGYAMDVTLEWDANAEPDLAGYKVYYDTDSGHPYDGTEADEGNSGQIEVDEDTTFITLHGLPDSEVYFFVVTAYDTEGLESDYSNEVATLSITWPQGGFYVNAGNYTSYTVEGAAIANAEDIIVKSDSDAIGGPFTADSYGNWSGACDFSSISEGAVSLTAESGCITSPAVTGTYDKTAPTSIATAPDYLDAAPIYIEWEAEDATSGVYATELWYKGPGDTWANTGLDAQTGTSGTFSYTPTQGDGTYYFATRSTDNAGNVEVEPSGDGDDSTIFDATGEGCSTATAASGSDMDRHVQILPLDLVFGLIFPLLIVVLCARRFFRSRSNSAQR